MTAASIPMDLFVRSTFVLLEEADATMEEIVRLCLKGKHTEEVLKHVTLEGRALSVDHNPCYLTTAGVTAALKHLMYDILLEADDGGDGLWALARSEDAATTVVPHTPPVGLTVVLSGTFWLVSMGAYLGPHYMRLGLAGLLSVACGLPPIAAKALSVEELFSWS